MKTLVVMLLLVSACSSPTSVDDYLASVVGIEAHGCSLVAALGSGAIMGDRQVVTSAHTVAGANEINVIDADERSLSAVLVAFDPAKDLAVLQVEALDREPLVLGQAAPDQSGWVLAWNRDDGPHEIPMSVTKRILVRIEDIYVDEIVERAAIEIDAEVVRGDSGAAVITKSGEVVGIVYATSRSRQAGFALNAAEIEAILDRAGTTAVDPGPCT
jgi:S1-C subfamily serine protease